MGGESTGPLCFRSLVPRGGRPVYQPLGVAGDPTRVASFCTVPEGSHGLGPCGQYHRPGLSLSSGGTFSPALNREAQFLLRWSESFQIRLAPQFIMGAKIVVAGSLSRLDQVIGSEWTLAQELVSDLVRRWPATIDLFATSLNYCLLVYFLLVNDPMVAGTDAFRHSWDHLQAYAFPPFSLLRQVLAKLRSSRGALLTLVAPLWPQRDWYPDLLAPSVAPLVALPMRPDLLRQPHVHRLHQNLPMLPSCLGTVEQFARHLGLSRRVTQQISLWCHLSLCRLYQHRLGVYRRWCADRGHAVSSPTIAKIADFLFFLGKDRNLSVATVRGFRTTLSSVFKYILPVLCV